VCGLNILLWRRKQLALRAICAGVYRDPTARHLRQMRKAILTWLQYYALPDIEKKNRKTPSRLCVWLARIEFSLTHIETEQEMI
jgi:hypothetical protein